MSYLWLRRAAIAITIWMVVWNVIYIAPPDVSLLSAPLRFYLNALTLGLAALLGFLPRVHEAERRVTDQGPPVETDVDAAKREAADG